MNRATKRNIIGTVLWFLMGVLLGWIVPVAAMTIREYRQSVVYDIAYETGDFWRYLLAIGLGATLHWFIIMTYIW